MQLRDLPPTVLAVCTLLLVSCRASVAATPPPPPPPSPPAPSATISPDKATYSVRAGATTTTTFGLTILNAPQTNDECTISGPTYKWSGGSPGTGSDVTAENYTVTTNFSTLGTVPISVGCTITWTSTCSDASKNSSIQLSPSATATFTVGHCAGPF